MFARTLTIALLTFAATPIFAVSAKRPSCDGTLAALEHAYPPAFKHKIEGQLFDPETLGRNFPTYADAWGVHFEGSFHYGDIEFPTVETEINRRIDLLEKRSGTPMGLRFSIVHLPWNEREIPELDFAKDLVNSKWPIGYQDQSERSTGENIIIHDFAHHAFFLPLAPDSILKRMSLFAEAAVRLMEYTENQEAAHELAEAFLHLTIREIDINSAFLSWMDKWDIDVPKNIEYIHRLGRLTLDHVYSDKHRYGYDQIFAKNLKVTEGMIVDPSDLVSHYLSLINERKIPLKKSLIEKIGHLESELKSQTPPMPADAQILDHLQKILGPRREI